MDSFVFPIIDSGSGGDSDNDDNHDDKHDDDRHEQDDVEPPPPFEDEHENTKQDEDGKYICLYTSIMWKTIWLFILCVCEMKKK